MEPFDGPIEGNTLDFHLEHSNCYLFYVFKFRDPYLGPKKNSSEYGVYGIQNDRLEPMVSTQKSVLKNMHRVPRYWLKHPKLCRFGLVS